MKQHRMNLTLSASATSSLRKLRRIRRVAFKLRPLNYTPTATTRGGDLYKLHPTKGWRKV